MTVYENLADLKLFYLAENLDDFLTQSKKSKLDLRAFVDRFIELEIIEKSRRSTERRLREAKLGKFKGMHQFDWNWPQGVDRRIIEGLLTCEFIKDRKNLILAGPQGLGKTMIAQNIAHNAVMAGHTVLYTTASNLVIDLGSQESTAALQRRFKKYERPHLLVIDEIGYLSFDNASADYLFEIVNRRYEEGSIIMTTNLAFKDWHTVFPGSPCVTAMIDRLTHHAEILKITGDSFRHKESSKKRGV